MKSSHYSAVLRTYSGTGFWGDVPFKGHRNKDPTLPQICVCWKGGSDFLHFFNPSGILTCGPCIFPSQRQWPATIRAQNATQVALRREFCLPLVREIQALSECEAENKEACLLVSMQVGVEHLMFWDLGLCYFLLRRTLGLDSVHTHATATGTESKGRGVPVLLFSIRGFPYRHQNRGTKRKTFWKKQASGNDAKWNGMECTVAGSV